MPELDLKTALDSVTDPWGPRQDFMTRGFELGYAAAIGEVVEWLNEVAPDSGWTERVAKHFERST